MKIQIIRCTKQAWYQSEIGKIVEVENFTPTEYKIKGLPACVKKEDAVAISEDLEEDIREIKEALKGISNRLIKLDNIISSVYKSNEMVISYNQGFAQQCGRIQK